MNLLDSINAIIEQISAILRTLPAGPDFDRLSKLRDVFDALSDQAVHNLFDTTSADYGTAINSLQNATTAAKAASQDMTKVSGAINTAVTAAKDVDKVLGFLAHL